MLKALNGDLDAICDGLNRKGLNYSAFLCVFSAPGRAGQPARDVVRAAVGPEAEIGGQPSVSSLEELLSELRAAVRYEGGDGSHPTPGFSGSAECARLLKSASARLRAEFARAGAIHSLSFSEGHPHYPVFWDFAFLVEREADAFVFVGASSD